ncbi:MAG: ABC transporter ATP-binding protein [Victivallales bacterium]|jgi:ABC-type lipoprotein export system ATPase subunit|nr:ABC transporter ATP-binding protein [Victivallales bacterium]
MKLIELKNITKTYFLGEIDVPVLKGITFDIEKGEYVALMGASGSGKSTLMNILGCLDRPTSGEYRLDGEEIGGVSGDRRAVVRNKKIGFVFQSFNLLPRTSALDNVIMPLSYTAGGLSRRECRRRGIEMLEKVGLSDRMHHYPSQLSGGQQQRVAIARALINHPPLLFADEPTGNLDSKTSIEVMQMFGDLNAQGISVILVTHSAELANYAKRTIHLQDGQIVAGAAAKRARAK